MTVSSSEHHHHHHPHPHPHGNNSNNSSSNANYSSGQSGSGGVISKHGASPNKPSTSASASASTSSSPSTITWLFFKSPSAARPFVEAHVPFPLPSRCSKLPDHSCRIDLDSLFSSAFSTFSSSSSSSSSATTTNASAVENEKQYSWLDAFRNPHSLMQVLFLVVHMDVLEKFTQSFLHTFAVRSTLEAQRKAVELRAADEWAATEEKCRAALKKELLTLYAARKSDVSETLAMAAEQVVQLRRRHQEKLAADLADLAIQFHREQQQFGRVANSASLNAPGSGPAGGVGPIASHEDPWLAMADFLKGSPVELLLVARGIGADQVAACLLEMIKMDSLRFRNRKEWHAAVLYRDAVAVYAPQLVNRTHDSIEENASPSASFLSRSMEQSAVPDHPENVSSIAPTQSADVSAAEEEGEEDRESEAAVLMAEERHLRVQSLVERIRSRRVLVPQTAAASPA
eukprot:ANDGO_02629.mRNA.1 hypothetical protein